MSKEMEMTWTNYTDATHGYLEARTRRKGARYREDNWNPRTGLYVAWLENSSPYRVRDYQRHVKTEVLPGGCSVKAGRYKAGFFERRDLDDRQLHVAGSATRHHPHWRKNRSNDWLVYRSCCREIYTAEGHVEEEPRLLATVRAWLTKHGLAIQPHERPRVIAANNARDDLEPISHRDFPRGEWIQLHRFDGALFAQLMQHVIATFERDR